MGLAKHTIHYQPFVKKMPEKNEEFRRKEIELGKNVEYHRVNLANMVADDNYLWGAVRKISEEKKWSSWADINKEDFRYIPRRIDYNGKSVTLFFANLEDKLDRGLNGYMQQNPEIDDTLNKIFDLRNELAEKNRYLVNYFFKRRNFNTFSYRNIAEDLIQEGNIGLVKAAQRFDYKFGFRFTAYAVHYIYQAFDRKLSNESTIHIPIVTISEIAKFKKLLGRDGRSNSPVLVEQIAEELDIPANRITEHLQWSKLKKTVSLSSPINPRDGSQDELIEMVEDPKSTNFVNNIDRERTCLEVRRKLEKRLSHRDVQIILRRADGESLKKIGEDYDLTRERIRQIYSRNLKKLSKTFRNLAT